MSTQQPGAPDWSWLGGIAAILAAAGGVWAATTGFFRQRKTDQSAMTEQTLGNIWQLVNELQEERTRAAASLERCGAITATLEAELRRAKAEIDRLKRELSRQRDERT